MGNGLKAGVQTSEFWLALITQVISMAVMFGWVKPGDAKSLEDALKQIVVGTFTVVMGGLVAYKYIHDRGVLKQLVYSNGNENSKDVPSVIPNIPQLGGK
jgi:hypothetical protein